MIYESALYWLKRNDIMMHPSPLADDLAPYAQHGDQIWRTPRGWSKDNATHCATFVKDESGLTIQWRA